MSLYPLCLGSIRRDTEVHRNATIVLVVITSEKVEVGRKFFSSELFLFFFGLKHLGEYEVQGKEDKDMGEFRIDI